MMNIITIMIMMVMILVVMILVVMILIVMILIVMILMVMILMVLMMAAATILVEMRSGRRKLLMSHVQYIVGSALRIHHIHLIHAAVLAGASAPDHHHRFPRLVAATSLQLLLLLLLH
jgi:hypothetical protein